MRKIKEVLRLKFEAKLSHEKIAAATGMSKGAVTNTVHRALEKGLAWPLPAQLDEAGLEALMYRKMASDLTSQFRFLKPIFQGRRKPHSHSIISGTPAR
jgi:hypothetical protein